MKELLSFKRKINYNLILTTFLPFHLHPTTPCFLFFLLLLLLFSTMVAAVQKVNIQMERRFIYVLLLIIDSFFLRFIYFLKLEYIQRTS